MPKTVAQKAPAAAKGASRKRKVNGYQMPERIPIGMILTDLSKQQWKIGPSIGVGGFGEIYCACKANDASKKHDDYPFVVKVEPHGNGPLFVEMHFYMRNGKLADIEDFRKKRGLKSLGMPHFVGHGSQDLNGIKHRFIVMPRYGADIWDLFMKNGDKMPVHTAYRLAVQMIDVYEYIHNCTYVHGDLKGSNMLLGFGKGGNAQAYLVDFGLASHYTTKDFKPDPKKMHNGTIEYTSRDAHQGVPTMRGDLEVLAFNMIQWVGGILPWKTMNLLAEPLKVQQAKEHLMEDIDQNIKECFTKTPCPAPLLSFLKLIDKLKFDEKPNYDQIRKDFLKGLQSLGKTNSGDLDFKASTSLGPPLPPPPVKVEKKTKRPADRPSTSSGAQKSQSDSDGVSPKPRKTASKLKRSPPTDTDTSDASQSPLKKSRATAKQPSSRNVVPTQSTDPKSADSEVILKNRVIGTKSNKPGKTYELNFELDISFDANVVVNVKRRPKKSSKSTKAAEQKSKSNDDSIDEIPATEKSFAVGTATVTKRGVRSSPRTKK